MLIPATDAPGHPAQEAEEVIRAPKCEQVPDPGRPLLSRGGPRGKTGCCKIIANHEGRLVSIQKVGVALGRGGEPRACSTVASPVLAGDG